MKLSLALPFSFAVLTAATPYDQLQNRAAPGCVADNCLRALTVTDSNLKATRPVWAKSDCSAILQPTTTLTVTPAVQTFYQTSSTLISTLTTTFTTGTITSTITVPTTIIVNINGTPLKKRNEDAMGIDVGLDKVSPRDVAPLPSYLSACTSTARLASACSCAFGIKPTTITVSSTLPAVSVTITTSITSIATQITTASLSETATTTVIVPVATQTAHTGPFRVRAFGSGFPATGEYLQHQSLGTYFDIPYFKAGTDTAIMCQIDPSTRVVSCTTVEAPTVYSVVHLEGCANSFQIRDGPASLILRCDVAQDRKLVCDPVVQSATQVPGSAWSTCTYSSYTFSGGANYLVQGVTCLSQSCFSLDVYAEFLNES